MVGVFAVGLITALALWAPWRPAPAPPLVRLSADLGPDAVAGLRVTVAISRDGRRIVFPIRGANGTQQLATRLLDQATSTPLPGTENGEQPFFDPGGQWIAFAADGKLKKIPVLGGAAFALCAAPGLRGGSWGEDGTIVAALDGNVLSRVSDAGGTPQALTSLVSGERTHRWPQILPGGQAVLFTASTNTSAFEDATIEVLSVKTGQVTTVARGGYAGRYLAGRLVYMHLDVLFSVSFDQPSLTVQATPAPLLDDVAAYQTSGAGQFDVSETGTFVYRSGKASSAAFPVVWLDSAGKTQPLLPKPANYSTPRVSPDGRYLALAADNGKSADIYVYDTERDALSRLTSDGHQNYWPVWTPDGKHLVYASGTDKTIWWIRADGAGEPQPLLVSKGGAIPSSFSADGRYLSYAEFAADTKTDLWILPVDASNAEHPKPGTPEVFLKTPATEGVPILSPDGHWMAYTSDESSRFEVWVRPFHSAIGGKSQVSTSGGAYAYWSRDGRSLYYLGLDRRIMVVDYTTTRESFVPGKPRVWSETPVRLLFLTVVISAAAAARAELPRYDRVLLLETTSETSANVSIGDLNHDGNLDIVLAKGRHWPLVNRVLIGDGRGGIREAYDLGTASDKSYSARLVDLDGDGSLDVVISNDAPSPKLVYLNDGTGHFRVGSTYGKPEWQGRNATIADMNGDGKPDIVAANRTGPDPGANYICLNRGAGRFDADCTKFSSESATTITAADFNGDGFTDLLVPHRDGGQSRLYFGGKNADLANLRSIPFGPAHVNIRMAEAADFNGDGHLDVVTIDEAAGVTIYDGRGDGTFSDPRPIGDRKVIPYALTTGDLNCDGKVDFIVGNVEAPSVVYFNDGDGTRFTPVPVGDNKGTAYGIAIGDINKDGRPDIAVALSEAPNVLYLASGPIGRCK